MKKFIYVMIGIVSCSVASFAIQPNVNLRDKVEKALVAKTSATLKTVLDMEEANTYQRSQIEELVSKLASKVNGKKFDSLASVIFYLNKQLPTTGEEDSILLKNAFAEAKGQEPKENLDCDSRAILVKSVLEILGYPYGKVWLATLPNHAVLTDGTHYYDLISGKMETYSGDDLALLHQLDADNQFKSLLVANLATYQKSLSGGAFNYHSSKAEEAKKLFKKAIELDPTNINALKNFVNSSGMESTEKYQRQIIEVMVYNYLRNTGRPTKVTDAEVIRVLKICPSVQDELFSLTMGDTQDGFWAARILVQAGINPGGWFSFVMARWNFALGDYVAMRKNLDNAYKLRGVDDYLRKNNTIVLLGSELSILSQITSGKISASDTEKLKSLTERSRVLSMILLGDSISFDFMEIGNAFASWKGCRNFVGQVSEADFPNKRTNFCEPN